MNQKPEVRSQRSEAEGRIFLFWLLISVFWMLPSVGHAEIIDRVIAVVNDSIITLSELNDAVAGMDVVKDGKMDKQKKIIETKSKMLDQLVEKKLVEQAANKAGITVSEKEIDNAIEDVKKQNNMTDEELLRVLAKNNLTYKSYREQLKEQIRQVKFINRQFRLNAKISDEDVEVYYKQHPDRFAGTVKHRLRIISFLLDGQGKLKDVENKANDVHAMAKRGEDFSRLARLYSQGANAGGGGDLGYIAAGELDYAIEKAAAGLKIGEVSDIIRTSTGFHIIQVADRQHPQLRPLSEVGDEIRNIIFQKIIDERYNLWLEEMMKKAYIEVRL